MREAYDERRVYLMGALRELGFELGRLKKGTPPRLRRASIDWESLAPQHGDADPAPFSDLTTPGRGLAPARAPTFAPGEAERVRSTLERWRDAGFEFERFPLLAQVECRQSATCAAAHEVIRAAIPHHDKDRELHRDVQAMVRLIDSGELLGAVRRACYEPAP